MVRTMSERVVFLIQCTGCVLGIRCLTTIEFMHACWVGKGQLSKNNSLFKEGLGGGHVRYHTCIFDIGNVWNALYHAMHVLHHV